MDLQFQEFREEDFPIYQTWYEDEVLARQLGPLDQEWLDAVLSTTDGANLCVFLDQELVAVVGVTFPTKLHPYYFINEFAVKPQLRKQGIGSQVLAQLIKRYQPSPPRSWKAVVSKGNLGAKRFFERAAWQSSPLPDESGMYELHWQAL